VLLFIIAFFLFGLAVGSFLNVLIYRLPRGLKFAGGRSFCPKCHHKISWFDNIPIFSFIFLGGKCRHCHSPISWKYPGVELITGIVTVIILNFKFEILNQFLTSNFKNILEVFLYLILVWSLIVIFFIDLEHQIIPDEILFPVIVLFLLFFLATDYQLLVSNYLLPALGSFLFLFIIWAVTRGRGMGFGDVKLAFLMGLCLGFPRIILAFYIAFLTGAMIGVILILFKKKKFGQHIAFGPFLTLGTFVSLIWGEKVINLVQKIFLN
jgi:prepilin signal peptidase PulO-like enzyme (type II secretory pathway)